MPPKRKSEQNKKTVHDTSDVPSKKSRTSKKFQSGQTKCDVNTALDENASDKPTISDSDVDGKYLVKIYDWCKSYPGALPSLAAPNCSKDGKSWNFKLVSWNINGLKACVKSGAMEYVKIEAPDILAVQEIKCALPDIPSGSNLKHYFTYWNAAEKKGYAGTGLYSKHEPIDVKYGIGKKKHNNEGRVITAEYERFYFVTAYVPNSGQGLVRLPYREKEWDPDFTDYLKQLDARKPVIVCGDLNVAHTEIDLANPASNHRSAGFTDEERAGFTKLLDSIGLVDTYRHLYPDRIKAYTFWSYRSVARPSNTGWRLDYFLVSKRLLPHVCDQEIRCGVQGSDHCPLVLYLHF